MGSYNKNDKIQLDLASRPRGSVEKLFQWRMKTKKLRRRNNKSKKMKVKKFILLTSKKHGKRAGWVR